MSNIETKAEADEIGLPLADISIIANVLSKLIDKGTHSIFLARGALIRLIGDLDALYQESATALGITSSERDRLAALLQEILMILQVHVVVANEVKAIEMLEQGPFSDVFEAADKEKEKSERLRHSLKTKYTLIVSLIALPGAIERSKRLRASFGPLLDDLDVDVISRRQSLEQRLDIRSVFLRIKIRYTSGGDSNLPFSMPPWFTDESRSLKSLDLECDEMDIDFLVARLLSAKELLKQSIKTP